MKLQKIQDLLKGNYKCQSILTQGKWTFSFSKISGRNYYIKKVSDDNPPSKQFAVLKKYNILRIGKFSWHPYHYRYKKVSMSNIKKLS